MNTYRATVQRRRVLLAAAVLFLIGIGWGMRHVYSTAIAINGGGTRFGYIFTAAFVMLAIQMAMCFFEPIRKTKPEQQFRLDREKVVCQVPVHNEDIDALKACIYSVLEQTRPVQLIHVVENGVNGVDYTNTRKWFKTVCAGYGIHGVWRVTPKKGKRQAQGVTVRETPWADLYLTVDSDAVLAPDALEEMLHPFSDPKVFSVAGIVLAINNRKKMSDGTFALSLSKRSLAVKKRASNFGKNLLCRMTDFWFVVGQLVDRSSQSAMGSVLVNSGVLAVYRAEVLRDNLDGYLNETFFGRPVEFSDDSMLTIYALQRGKAVQQPSAFAFTLMPETLSHHIRQYARWMRGAFIRTWWRFRYLPLGRYAFWAHFLGWLQMGISTYVFVYLFVYEPITAKVVYPYLIVVPILVGYMQGLRYLSYTRSDESTGSRLLTYLLCPVAALWAFFVLRLVRWYAMATCLKTGWGTRQEVEIGMTVAE